MLTKSRSCLDHSHHINHNGRRKSTATFLCDLSTQLRQLALLEFLVARVDLQAQLSPHRSRMTNGRARAEQSSPARNITTSQLPN